MMRVKKKLKFESIYSAFKQIQDYRQNDNLYVPFCCDMGDHWLFLSAWYEPGIEGTIITTRFAQLVSKYDGIVSSIDIHLALQSLGRKPVNLAYKINDKFYPHREKGERV